MPTRCSYRVVTAAVLIVSALALTAAGAEADSAGAGTGASLRSPAWMRQAPIHATPPVGGDLTEAELPGASNPSEPYAAASQAVQGGRHPRGVSGGIGAMVRTTVNPVTGDFSLSLSDLFVPERGVPLGLSLTYNSYFASKDGPFGRGWSFNAGMSLTKASDGSVTVRQENGSQVTFQQVSGRYVAPPRVIASLSDASGTFVFIRGTRSSACPSYSRSCVKFFFSEPVGFTPGRLTKVFTRDGGLNLAYSKRRLTTVKDPAGRTLTFAYKNGKVSTTALDANDGHGDHMTYDTKGNLTRFTNAGGGRLGFLYDAYHRLTGIVDPRGAETDVVYDSTGHVQSITDPAGETDFSRSSGQTTVSRPGAYTATAHYMDGEVTRIDEGGDPAAPLATTLITYDPATVGPTAVTDPDGHTTNMTYDALGHLTSYTDPLGHTSVYHFGQATGITATDPTGTVSKATTDSAGRVLSVALDTGHPALTETTTFHYGNPKYPGDVTAVRDPEGNLWRYTYDRYGNRTSSTDPLGDKSSTVYDRMGRPAINTALNGNVAGADPSAFSTTYTYDPEGRMLSTTDPLGNTKTFSYDAAGNLLHVIEGGHQTSYGYDAVGRLIVVTRPDGSHATIKYGSGSQAPKREQCDDSNNCTKYTYDDLGRLATVADPLGNTSSYAYSPGGLLDSGKNANGVTTSYTHDAAGQTTGVSYSDGVTHPVTYDYDADGQLIGMTDGSGTSSFTYDSLGRRKKSFSGLGSETEVVAYGRLNQVTSMTLNGTPMASYTYDDAGRMASVSDRLGNTTTFSYDASSNLTQTLFPGGGVDQNGYDNAGRMIAVDFSLFDSSGDPASVDVRYRRNLLGQITGDTQTGTGQTDQAYAYDANGRLAAVNTNPVSFDSRDNLLQNAAGDTFTYDAADRLVSEDQKSVTPDINWAFGYDDNGSRSSAFTLDGTRSQDFVWDAAGNLTSFTDGSTSETNTYDGLGRQASSSSGGTSSRYVWDSRSQVWSALRGVWGSGPTDPPDKTCGGGGGSSNAIGQVLYLARFGKCVATDSGDFKYRTSGPVAVDSTTFIYGPEGLPVEQLDGSDNALFYHHDQLGSTRAVTDAGGHTVEIVAYDTYGNEAYHSGSVNVPFGFGGAYTDPVSHLVLIGHDYYDPPTGQFLARGGITAPGPNVGRCAAAGIRNNGEACEPGSSEDAAAVRCPGDGKVNTPAGENCDSSAAKAWPVRWELFDGSAQGLCGTSARIKQDILINKPSVGSLRCGSSGPIAPPIPNVPMPNLYAFRGGDPVNGAVERSGVIELAINIDALLR